MVHPKRRILTCLLTLAMLLSMTGCAAVSAGRGVEDTKAAAKSVAGDNETIADYLKTARSELGLMDEIFADKDIGLLEEETDSDEELSVEEAEKYERILTGYTDRIQAALGDIDKNIAPDLPDITHFKTAEKAAFQTLDSILREYSQTLNYYGTMMQTTENMAALENIQETDLQAIYDAFSTGIGDMITALEGASVPSYFESFNQDLIDVLRQLDNAVYYLLTAIAIDDPVRYDSGEYFLEILVRRTDEISLNGVTDMEERLGKLREDILAVQNTCAGLTGWLDTNIANLDGK